MTITIRPVSDDDASSLTRIYNHYVSNTLITFETELVASSDMAERITEAATTQLPWLVAETYGEILGYACVSEWKGRCAYRFSVESTIYLDPQHTGKGVGTPLYATLIEATQNMSMHSMIAGIALPNKPSIKLHERLGYKKVGQFDQVGFKQNRWVDVGYWQLML